MTNGNHINASRTGREYVSRETQDFGLYDSKGREIGYAVNIIKDPFEADVNGPWLVPQASIDCPYVIEPHALRNGSAFGARPVRSYQRAASIEQARKIKEAMFARARKAAEKKAVR